jgi:predicted amidohydrolase
MEMGDAQEKLIRERQRQMAENKARILAAYAEAAKEGSGPKTVILPELGPRSGAGKLK